jgi:hypothetical protein
LQQLQQYTGLLDSLHIPYWPIFLPSEKNTEVLATKVKFVGTNGINNWELKFITKAHFHVYGISFDVSDNWHFNIFSCKHSWHYRVLKILPRKWRWTDINNPKCTSRHFYSDKIWKELLILTKLDCPNTGNKRKRFNQNVREFVC